jgi:hypothetical protein
LNGKLCGLCATQIAIDIGGSTTKEVLLNDFTPDTPLRSRIGVFDAGDHISE